MPWLGYTRGVCAFYRGERENLCDEAAFTGYQIDGGYAEYTLADARYVFPIEGIHVSDIPSVPYRILWQERRICSVANLTRRDGEEFLALAPKVPVRTEVELFPLDQANDALDRLRDGRITGAAVLTLGSPGMA